ncbi:MAG: amidohydrolase [Phycisphaerales bacterium]|nr:amidohydrolase [Planctomycetota bacterium]MCH8509300.1 amidohydrolase [Phycisphaerales bacterium]
MPTTAPDLAGLAARLAAEIDDLTRIRRDLHAHPEVRFEEHRTGRVVQDELARLGIRFVAGLGGHEPGQGTGVLAHLPATVDRPGPCIGLRADMDALPIAERTAAAWASTIPGRMHACGHDGHTAILLGAARVLAATEHRPNPVTFVFQPAEEGGGGGELMCRDGCLTGGPDGDLGPPVTRMYGLHGWPGLPLGVIGTRPGPLLAATDELHLTVRGRQAHAAYPHLGADPIVAGAHIVAAVQTLASRTVSPLDSIVVTFGTFHAGTATNVIPETATLTGTLRTLRAETRVLAKARLKELAESAARALGCEAELRIEEGYPVTLNDPGEAARVLEVAREANLARGAVEVPEPSMGGEDFAYYANRVPSCFYLLGLRPDGADGMPELHQPEFDFPDGAIGPGVEMMCRLALR